ncbi:hypothetical protein BpHYR1_048987 [Brachionus plicatilis]|uniref:Uncharacterized protein n=1 Tax=Brachionus plicatilis TaxID=10195 RepID=A0A3M7PTG8_BRAPC|nr:hypothetical protein BpHYR1_048987 [Brachionus plicatilis]
MLWKNPIAAKKEEKFLNFYLIFYNDIFKLFSQVRFIITVLNLKKKNKIQNLSEEFCKKKINKYTKKDLKKKNKIQNLSEELN